MCCCVSELLWWNPACQAYFRTLPLFWQNVVELEPSQWNVSILTNWQMFMKCFMTNSSAEPRKSWREGSWLQGVCDCSSSDVLEGTEKVSRESRDPLTSGELQSLQGGRNTWSFSSSGARGSPGESQHFSDESFVLKSKKIQHSCVFMTTKHPLEYFQTTNLTPLKKKQKNPHKQKSRSQTYIYS